MDSASRRSEFASASTPQLRNGVEFSAFDVPATTARLSDRDASPLTRGDGNEPVNPYGMVERPGECTS